MTDVGVDTAADAVEVRNVQAIPVTKAGKGVTVDVDFDSLPIEVYKEMLFLGAKEYINSVKMSKIGAGLTKLSGIELEKAQAAVLAQAQKNAADMLGDGNTAGPEFKFHGTKSETKVSGAVNTEAMRLAKNITKDLMKKAGLKISHTPASEITAAAKVVLSQMPDLYKTAEENLKKRAETPVKGIDIKALVKADPELVKKAEAAKAKKKSPKAEGQLSAKQAGLVAPRQKPSGAARPTAH